MKLLREYCAANYTFDTVELRFVLDVNDLVVHSRIHVTSAIQESAAMFLDGRELELLYLKINGKSVPEVELTSTGLLIPHPPECPFVLEIGNRILNTTTNDEGLYYCKGHGYFVTNCEPDRFSRITFFQDRPDVMSKFTVHVEVNEADFPVVLSNGNMVSPLTWVDPFPKPCYLFALAAGRFASRDETFVTASGRPVMVKVWSLPQDVAKTEYAMKALLSSMKWDEDTYGLEYDLEALNVVCVPDFMIGAMENKGLIIGHTRFMLLSPWCSTDDDITFSWGLMAHEYFHNWTGNRVTCRDWFQLSLKEGLTDFREQEFCSSVLGNCSSNVRIRFVSELKRDQFPEDSSPAAHPVRPISYGEVDNLFTETVYKKGAEVLRMYQTLLGNDGFKKGLKLYITQHDGKAVTCEDFYQAMCDANHDDLPGFMLWYTQAGTPKVFVTHTSYVPLTNTFTLRLKQDSAPMLIPVAVGLLDKFGTDILPMVPSITFDGVNADLSGQSTLVLRLTKEEHDIVFHGVPEKPVMSLLRGFSAPVKLVLPEGDDDWDRMLFLFEHDSDEYSSWDCGQKVATHIITKLTTNDKITPEVSSLLSRFISVLGKILSKKNLNAEFISKAISLPSKLELIENMENVDPDALHAAYELVRKNIATQLRDMLVVTVIENRDDSLEFKLENKGARALKNVALKYLASIGDEETKSLARLEYENANNITELLGAFATMMEQCHDENEKQELFEAFHGKWKHESQMVNKFLALVAEQSSASSIRKIMLHPSFDREDQMKVSAVVGGFFKSVTNFHAKDGSGYEYMAEVVQGMNDKHPRLLSRLLGAALKILHKLETSRQLLAKEKLRAIATNGSTSKVVLDRIEPYLK